MPLWAATVLCFGSFGALFSAEGRLEPWHENRGVPVPSRRGLTPRGSLECNPEIPAFPGALPQRRVVWTLLRLTASVMKGPLIESMAGAGAAVVAGI